MSALNSAWKVDLPTRLLSAFQYSPPNNVLCLLFSLTAVNMVDLFGILIHLSQSIFTQPDMKTCQKDSRQVKE